jgi:hypothetical protein
MCEIEWALLSGFISAVASLANATLLIWMILVTKKYVQATLALLDVNRRSLEYGRQQYLTLIDREVRPYKNVLERSIQRLEELKKRDLVYAFENRNEIGWLREEDLLPSDFTNVTIQAMSFDAEVYTSLEQVSTKLILRPKDATIGPFRQVHTSRVARTSTSISGFARSYSRSLKKHPR